VSELNVLFNSDHYTVGVSTRGQAAESSHWAPLMGPFVGARIEEIAQLRVEDVLCNNGVWTLRICCFGPDQRLKNNGSYRLVPIHEELIKVGLLAYAAEQKRMGHTDLFHSQLRNNQHKILSNALGKWHSRYLDSIGLTDIRLCYHSNRFLFKQRLSICGVSDEARDALAGHWQSVDGKQSKRGYMAEPLSQYPFPLLVRAMKKLRYDELDLSHLYVKEPMKGVETLLEHRLEVVTPVSTPRKKTNRAARLAAC
jgi:hypothetical protein